jgi:hypothetical protein
MENTKNTLYRPKVNSQRSIQKFSQLLDIEKRKIYSGESGQKINDNFLPTGYCGQCKKDIYLIGGDEER